MLILGIDPGLSGALALYAPTRGEYALTVTDMPVHVLKVNGKVRRRLDGHSLARCDAILAAPTHAILENVHSMPKQGIASAFSFGKVFGAIEQCLIDRNIPYTLVEPALWKRVLGVPADKDGARRRASQLMPRFANEWAAIRGVRNKDQAGGRAEAALLAYYGSRLQTAARSAPKITVLEIFT
jgi:crossover junction endodeoxyribonuclease RuvC